MKLSVNTMVKLAMLSAISIILLIYVRFPLFSSFLYYEPADVPILIASFLFGPIEGLMVTFVVALIQALTFNASDGWVGFLMHVIATGTLVTVASLIYKKIHNYKGAIIALIAGTLSMTLIMIPANLIITVNFYKTPFNTVLAMLPTAIIPFNLVKAIVNSVLTLCLYKAIGRVLRTERKQLKSTT